MVLVLVLAFVFNFFLVSRKECLYHRFIRFYRRNFDSLPDHIEIISDHADGLVIVFSLMTNIGALKIKVF